MRVLALADQPWQTELALDILVEIQKLWGKEFKAQVALADYYTFFNAPELLKDWREKYGFQINHQEVLYEKWQLPCNHANSEIKEFLEHWELEWCRERNLDQLQKTNPWIHGFERSFFYLKTPNCCRNQILKDTIDWTTNLIQENKFDFIFSIERYTLAINISNEISKKLGIPYFCIIPTRLKSRWFVSKYFGYGTDNELYKDVLSSRLKNESFLQADEHIMEIVENKSASYAVWRRGKFEYLTESNENKDIGKISTLFEQNSIQIVKFIKQFTALFFIHRRKLKYHPRILEQNYYLLMLYEAKALVYRIIRSYGISICGTRKPNLERDFYLWFLHMRPEGSGLVLSDAVDELCEIKKVVKKLPSNAILFVKENPLMLGYRKAKFYKDLRRFNNVVLIDPFFDNSLLFAKAHGTIGLSGTALIESMAHRKPTIVLGKPEFRDFIAYRGYEDLCNFFEANELDTDSFNLFRKYLAFLFENSSVNDVPEFTDNSDSRTKLMANSFAQRLLSCYQEYT